MAQSDDGGAAYRYKASPQDCDEYWKIWREATEKHLRESGMGSQQAQEYLVHAKRTSAEYQEYFCNLLTDSDHATVLADVFRRLVKIHLRLEGLERMIHSDAIVFDTEKAAVKIAFIVSQLRGMEATLRESNVIRLD